METGHARLRQATGAIAVAAAVLLKDALSLLLQLQM